MKTRTLAVGLLLTAASFPALAVPEGPEYNSAEWRARDLANVARAVESPVEQLTNPVFMVRWQQQSLTNILSLAQRNLADPSWLLIPNLNTPVTPLCTSWSQPCSGDPFRYPEAPGPDGAAFYETEAEVMPVVYYDRDCARISGHVWAPRNGKNGLPAVVIENGSVQAPEPIYWWAAQALIRSGYVVMTFDPRGQGRSDMQTPTGGQGGNFDSSVFWDGLVDAIDFFRSSSAQPYPHNETCAGTYPTEVAAFNPHIARIDASRLGIVGHSLGASGVSVVQSYGAPGAEPWPGLIDDANPVDVIVAWDGLSAPRGEGHTAVVPRVPAMGQTSEYGFTPLPATSEPDPEGDKAAFKGWQEAGVPTFQFTIQGSSHFEWSLIPAFPSSSWCSDTSANTCGGGWGRPLAEHYTVAWLDRWLKKSGEAGYDTADARLLADADWKDRFSFYKRAARDFPTRDGKAQVCEDIRAGCEVAGGGGSNAGGDSDGGGALGWLSMVLGLFAVGLRRFRQ